MTDNFKLNFLRNTPMPKSKKEKIDEVAITLACMLGAQEGFGDFAESTYRSAEIYEELTGKDIGLRRPEKPKPKLKWYQKLFILTNLNTGDK